MRAAAGAAALTLVGRPGLEVGHDGLVHILLEAMLIVLRGRGGERSGGLFVRRQARGLQWHMS